MLVVQILAHRFWYKFITDLSFQDLINQPAEEPLIRYTLSPLGLVCGWIRDEGQLTIWIGFTPTSENTIDYRLITDAETTTIPSSLNGWAKPSSDVEERW